MSMTVAGTPVTGMPGTGELSTGVVLVCLGAAAGWQEGGTQAYGERGRSSPKAGRSRRWAEWD